MPLMFSLSSRKVCSIKEFGYKFAETIPVLEMNKVYFKLICFLEDCWEEEEGKIKKQTAF